MIEEKDVDFSIYEVPLVLSREGLDRRILEHFSIPYSRPDLSEWESILDTLKNPEHHVEIAIVGKYIELTDAYKSIYESLAHAGISNRANVRFRKVAAEAVEAEGAEALLSGVQGILVPGGFGSRGIEGKIAAVRYARERHIPFFGICLGMQCATIEFARGVLDMPGAHSTEFDKQTTHPVISLLEEQKHVVEMGASMRLGAYPCRLNPQSRAATAYGCELVQERHRHRYEFNNEFREQFENAGMTFAGLSPKGDLVEIIELPDHPWFVACQFHPEFKSKPVRAHPLFHEFVRHAVLASGVRIGQESVCDARE